MNTQITVRHSKATKELRNTLSEEMEKLQKYSDLITSCHVIVDSEHVDKTVEIVLGVKKKSISAKAKSDNLGKAVDMAVEKIKKQLKKVNTKRKAHKGRKDIRQQAAAESISEEEESY